MSRAKPPAKASLTAALNDLLRDDFDGVPAATDVAQALDKIVASGEVSVRYAILLDAIARGLEGETFDGWRLSLKGRRGPKRTKQDGLKQAAVGQKFAKNLEEGCWESAVEQARKDGDKSPKEAYERQQNRLAIFMRARIPHEQRLEELRPLCLRATPKE
ncbi:MAG: hypothetical protein KAF42_01690 [Sphingopyxis terrae]|nr:hypothetical protein [Sphingopyxis terrae]